MTGYVTNIEKDTLQNEDYRRVLFTGRNTQLVLMTLRAGQEIGSETHEVWRPGYFNDLDRTFAHTFDRHVDDVLAALRAGHEPPIHARAGRRSVQLATAAVRSFEQGVRVAS
jgi:predicted dehydrogenase